MRSLPQKRRTCRHMSPGRCHASPPSCQHAALQGMLSKSRVLALPMPASCHAILPAVSRQRAATRTLMGDCLWSIPSSWCSRQRPHDQRCGHTPTTRAAATHAASWRARLGSRRARGAPGAAQRHAGAHGQRPRDGVWDGHGHELRAWNALSRLLGRPRYAGSTPRGRGRGRRWACI